MELKITQASLSEIMTIDVAVLWKGLNLHEWLSSTFNNVYI